MRWFELCLVFCVRVGFVLVLCFTALLLLVSTADLGTGVSESARRAPRGQRKARRSRQLSLSTGVICVLMLRVRWV